jgi:hypothetical protein
MKRPGFLSKLKKEGRLELVEPSEEMCTSHLQKAGDCLKSARIFDTEFMPSLVKHSAVALGEESG